MLDHSLYSFAIRAVLNEFEVNTTTTTTYQKINDKRKKLKSAKLLKLELVEKFRQLAADCCGIGMAEHQEMIRRNENSIAHFLCISIESTDDGQQRDDGSTTFVLQIYNDDQLEEQRIILASGMQSVEMPIPIGRNSILQLYSHPNTQQENEELAEHAPQQQQCRRRCFPSRSLLSPKTTTAGPSSSLCPSSTSSSSSSTATSISFPPKYISTERPTTAATAINTTVTTTSTSSKSGFLRRWTRSRQPVQAIAVEHAVQLLSEIRLRSVRTNQLHQITIPSMPHFRLKFEIKKCLANPQQEVATSSIGGDHHPHDRFQPMELFEFVTILRVFKAIFLQKLVDNSEQHSEAFGSTTTDTEAERRQRQQLGNGELTKAFRHFNEVSSTAEQAKKTLTDVAHIVARFNEFSALTETLLTIAVNLEECKFVGDLNNDEEKAQQLLELARHTIQEHSTSLKTAKIANEQELKAAIFLAEKLVQHGSELAKHAKCRELFVPSAALFPLPSPPPPQSLIMAQQPEMAECATTTTTTATGTAAFLSQRLAMHFGEFDQFANQISPLFDLLQSRIWTCAGGVSGLPTSISRLFEQSLQQQLSAFIRTQLPLAVLSGLDGFGDLVDSLRLYLTRPSTQIVERFMERVCVPFTWRVLQTVDDPLCVSCRQLLKTSIDTLNSRDDEQLLEFTKKSMRLFDAIRELSGLARQGHLTLQQFEPWFEQAAVFWTGTWRSVYVGFIRKCFHYNNNNTMTTTTSTTSKHAADQTVAVVPAPSGNGINFSLHGGGGAGGDCSPPSPSPPSPSLSASVSSPNFLTPRGSRQFTFPSSSSPTTQNFQSYGNNAAPLHEATINCLVFCKALCDDFTRLKAEHPSILLLGTLQTTSILADCLATFCAQVLQQLRSGSSTFSKLVRAANGIEHASSFLVHNFERFLEIQRLTDVPQMEEAEKAHAIAGIQHIMGTARARSRAIADQILDNLCQRKSHRIRQYAALITRNWEALSNSNGRANSSTMPFRSFLHRVFSPPNERADQLLLFLDKSCAHLHACLLPQLYSSARIKLWQTIRHILEQQLLRGESPDYYEHVENACDSICHILQLDWAEESCQIRRLLHANKATTKELILQYYAAMADKCAVWNQQQLQQPQRRYCSTPPTARMCVRIACMRTTGQQMLLQVHVLYAMDLPVLDTFSQSSDPYLRIELLPRCLFPLNQYPAQNTETKKQTLNPRWNQVFQIAIPEELFFINGACLCLSILDHDVMTYNDLAGQTFLPLAKLPTLKELCAHKLPSPLVLCLQMPNNEQFVSNEPFQILEQRGGRGDEMAREMSSYEKYIRNYRMLPPNAQDEKEWTVKGGMRKIRRMIGAGTGGGGGDHK